MPNRFLQARKAKRMTQAHLAIAAGIDERTVRKLEKGDGVSPETIRAVAAVLEIDLALSPKPVARKPTARVSPKLARLVQTNTILLQALIVVQAILAVTDPFLLMPMACTVGALVFLYVIKKDALDGHVFDRAEALFFTLPGAALVTTFPTGMLATMVDVDGTYVFQPFQAGAFLLAAYAFACFSILVATYAATIERSNVAGRTIATSMLRAVSPRRVTRAGMKFFRTLNSCPNVESNVTEARGDVVSPSR